LQQLRKLQLFKNNTAFFWHTVRLYPWYDEFIKTIKYNAEKSHRMVSFVTTTTREHWMQRITSAAETNAADTHTA